MSCVAGSTTRSATITATRNGVSRIATVTITPTLASLRSDEELQLASAEESAWTQPPKDPVAVARLASLDLSSERLGWRELIGWLATEESVETSRDLPASADASALAAINGTRYFFYSPEMSLFAETELRTAAGAPTVLYEYVWFNGAPVGLIDGGTATRWVFTDHLGTPSSRPTRRARSSGAEYEPYGRVYALRTADQHQPLRLPGQEAEQLNLGANGDTERSYNIFRWYRPAGGRYTQADPIGLQAGPNLLAYVSGNPVLLRDPLGLTTWSCGFGMSTANIPVGPGVGALGLICESECACGQQETVKVSGFLGEVSASPFLTVPGATTNSTITLRDSNRCPTPECLSGRITYSSAGFVTGIGPSFTDLKVGCASGRSKLSPGDLLTVGFDVGLDWYFGGGGVVDRTSSPCYPK